MARHRNPRQPYRLPNSKKTLNHPPGKHSVRRLAQKERVIIRTMTLVIGSVLTGLLTASQLVWEKRPRHLPKVESRSLRVVGVLFTALVLCISTGIMAVYHTHLARGSMRLETAAAYGPMVTQPPKVVMPPVQPVAAPSEPTSHTVAPGETLSGIAQSLGWLDATGKPDWKRVWGLNLGSIPNPDRISVGLVLNLTGSPASTPEWPPPQPQLSQKQLWLNAAQKMMDQGGNTYMPGLIMRELIARDLTPVAAAGFAGNSSQESGYRPDAIQQGGDWAVGLLQWTYDREAAMKRLAASEGKSWQDPLVQMEYTVQELHGSESATLAALQPVNDPAQAAVVVCKVFERAGDPRMSNRINAAVSAYNAFEQALNS